MWFLACLTTVVVAQGALTPARGYEVSGRLRTADDRPLLSGAVIMSPDSGSSAGPASQPEGRIGPDGSFTFADVPPGRYLIRARGETSRSGPTLFGTFAVSVTDSDIRGLELRLTPGAVIEGRLIFQTRHGSPQPPPGKLRVRAPLAGGSAFGDTLTGTPDSKGRFRLAGLMPGTHVLMIEGLPFPWRLAEGRLRGLDAVEHAFELDGSVTIDNVGLIVSDTAAGVAGTVAAVGGTPARDVLVVALPADPIRRRLPLRFVRSQRTTAPGTFRVLDLVPGEHVVVAATGLEESDLLRPEVLDALATLGTPIALREAEVGSVSVAPQAFDPPRKD